LISKSVDDAVPDRVSETGVGDNEEYVAAAIDELTDGRTSTQHMHICVNLIAN